MLRDVPGGGYRFLPGIEPYSSGAVALPGHAIVHVTLCAPVPWRDGFALIDRHLREKSRPRTALCAIALRIPKALSFDGFAEFNAGYREQLVAWGLLVDGRAMSFDDINPTAPTRSRAPTSRRWSAHRSRRRSTHSPTRRPAPPRGRRSSWRARARSIG